MSVFEPSLDDKSEAAEYGRQFVATAPAAFFAAERERIAKYLRGPSPSG